MKRLAIIGGSIFAVGVIIFFSVWALAGWDISKVGTRQALEKKELAVQNTNQTIVVNDENMPFNIGLSDDNQIHITYYENAKELYEIENGSSIEFTKQNRYKWYEYIFNFDFQKREFVILLPADFGGDLDIITSNGSVNADRASFKDLDVRTSNAGLGMKNVNGLGNVTFSTSNGGITVTDTALSGQLDAHTSNGGVTLDSLMAGNIQVETSNGGMRANKTASNQDIVLTTSNGAVNFDGLSAKQGIKLNSSNGGIFGKVLGDIRNYSIRSKTSNGKNNLPENLNLGSQLLEVSTSNGEINVEFTQQ